MPLGGYDVIRLSTAYAIGMLGHPPEASALRSDGNQRILTSFHSSGDKVFIRAQCCVCRLHFLRQENHGLVCCLAKMLSSKFRKRPHATSASSCRQSVSHGPLATLLVGPQFKCRLEHDFEDWGYHPTNSSCKGCSEKQGSVFEPHKNR